MNDQIVIIRDRNVFRIDAPPRTKIFNGDRDLGIDFDIVSVDGEMYLACHVMEFARTGQNGFRLVGFEPFPDDL